MRARVRKDTTAPTVRQDAVPWVVRAAATLPKGVRVSNPLFGEDPAGTLAILDTGGAPDFTREDMDTIASLAKDMLLVWDDSRGFARDALEAHRVSTFKIEGCEGLTFGATYKLPDAPWITHKSDPAVPDEETKADKADLAVAPGKPGHLQPEQEQRARRLRTKQEIEVPSVGLLVKSAEEITNEDGAEEHYILGVVLEPDEVDSQGDTISSEEIRRAAHRYMEEHGNVGLQHQTFVNEKIKILESYIAPVDFEIGEQTVKQGTWLMAFRVLDPSIWTAIKEGLLTGLSIGGSGLRLALS